MNSPQFKIGDLVRFKVHPSVLGIVIRIMRAPFIFKYQIRWSSPELFDSRGVRFGWKHDGWFNEHVIELAGEEKNE